MAVRQYIGAKYVPHGWTDWDAQTLYDPLYIVKYNLGWYILKKPLPQAGVLPTNEEYWALVDNWNGQVEEYSKQVQEYKETVDDLTPLVNYPSLALKNRKILIIGDSWGTGYNETTPYPTILNNMLPVTNASKNGYGFTGAVSYATFISIINETPDNGYTDVLIIGGTNDRASTTLVTDINNTLAAAKAKYKKATIWVGYAGLLNQSYGIITGYKRGATDNYVSYLNGLENVACANSDYTSTTHPTQACQQRLAAYIYSVLAGSVPTVNRSRVVTNLTATRGSITVGVESSVKTILIGYTEIDDAISGTNALGGKNDYLICTGSWYLPATIIGTISGTIEPVSGYYGFDGELKLYLNIPRDKVYTKIQVGPVTYNLPAFLA